jgi:hypothetical protein
MHTREAFGLPAGPVVFVAVATGNVVANLPPLFALFQEGDGLIWMTSEQAEGRGGLLARSKAAVAVRFPDLRQQEIHKLPEFPQFWEGSKEGELRLKIGQSTPVLIGNGGTKPMQDGLRSALRKIAGTEAVMVYGELRPPGFVVQATGGEGEAERHPYDRDFSIRIEEVLKASGHVPHWVRGSREACRLWPGPTPEAGAYGVEPGETFNIHRSAHDRARLRRVAETEVPAFAEAGFDDEAKEGLRRCLASQSRAAADGSDGALAGIYNNFRKAGQRASKIASKQFGELTSPVDDKLGNLFHRSVEQRVVAFLNDPHHAEIASRVSEVWTDFDIHRLDQYDEPSPESAANFDVFILLVNGVALHLECKSSLAAEGNKDKFSKDLTSRALRLQRATSTVARMIVCVPLYTGAASEDWCQEIAGDIEQRLRGAFDYVRFTLPGQPETFPALPERQVPEQSVPSFEAQLARLL